MDMQHHGTGNHCVWDSESWDTGAESRAGWKNRGGCKKKRAEGNQRNEEAGSLHIAGLCAV